MRQLNLETPPSSALRPTSLPDDATVGEVFLRFARLLHSFGFRFKDRLTVYGEYCMGLPEAQERINALQKRDTSFRTRVQECSEMANQKQFSLHDLLSLPYQRVLKYHLFLTVS